MVVIPENPTLVDLVLIRMRAEVPSLSQIRDKELYLRLHELRYLGWIERKLDSQGKWLYWRDNTIENELLIEQQTKL